MLFGTFTAVGPLFTEYSETKNILNFVVVPSILVIYHTFYYTLLNTMLLSLFETLIERVTNAPLIDSEKWALDTILLYQKFKDAFSLPLFIVLSAK